jgi:hypothetical protein
MVTDNNHDEYEHAGEWNCSHCGETKDVEDKLDVLVFALGHNCEGEENTEEHG